MPSRSGCSSSGPWEEKKSVWSFTTSYTIQTFLCYCLIKWKSVATVINKIKNKVNLTYVLNVVLYPLAVGVSTDMSVLHSGRPL